ncbi:helicase HerA domain-containing protein [Sphingosinicella sp.]|uniref:helicase HerA domain-containing protein n=1 Tax=Sphingosinicella sp. TaxID=1917971 RepID=UPI004037EB9C
MRAYLADTPFHDLFLTPVPLKLTHEERFNHMHVLGGTGAGKTTLIENLIHHDLLSDDPPSLVVIDPHGDLIRKLVRADLGIPDRLVIIDPRDVQYPPALNVFAINWERLGSYDEATREQVTAGVIETFDYLFSGLLGADLTAKQGVFFRYVARLMLALPDALGRNATILDMLALMSDAEPYREAIQSLPDIPREFFVCDFHSKTFAQTKDQIRYRLQAILENPTLALCRARPRAEGTAIQPLLAGDWSSRAYVRLLHRGRQGQSRDFLGTDRPTPLPRDSAQSAHVRSRSRFPR